ncbi:hypothetical protein ACFL1H_00165 [Nanoarchaeota archaeon]
MDKKGINERWIWWFVRVLVLVMFLGFVNGIYNLALELPNQDTDLKASMIASRVVHSPAIYIYLDPSISRSYSGIIDHTKFQKEVADKNFGVGQTKEESVNAIAFRAKLEYIEKDKVENEIQYYHEELFKTFSLATDPTQHMFEKKMFVLVRKDDKLLPGTLNLTIYDYSK